MDWKHSATVMFLGSLILGFFVTTLLLVAKFSHIRSSITKVYQATWMALWMVLIELYMFGAPPIAYTIVTAGIVLVFVLARRQVLVDDREYLKAMIQHHSSAILTSERILEKTQDQQVRKLAQSIIQSQQSEIELMNCLLCQ